MRRLTIALGLWVCPLLAFAQSPIRAEVTGASTFVPTLWAPGAQTRTLTGEVDHGSVFDPALRFGLSGTLVAALPASNMLSASWGMWRDQALCDTCGDGGGLGALGSELLGSTDLTLSLSHIELLSGEGLSSTKGAPSLVLRADLVLPASRDALSCNVMYAAPGFGAGFQLPMSGSIVGLSVSARRPFYRFDAAPVGRCAPPLSGEGEVATLTGSVSPSPFSGDWFGASNPSLSGAATASWSAIHQIVPDAPERLRTGLSSGLSFQRFPVDPAVAIRTLTGITVVPESTRPLRISVPWSVEAGYGVTDALDLMLSLSNRVPTFLTDPGGTLRALPASTAITASAQARF